MKWSPSQPNGWFPRLCPDGTEVLYGTGGTAFVAQWREGRERELTAGDRRVYPMGWEDDAPLCAFVPPRPDEEPITIHGQAYPSMNRFDARGGSWCTGRADGNQIWWDGRTIAGAGGWRCRCDGDLLTVATKTGIRVWGTHGTVIPCGELADHSIRGEDIGFHINRRARLYNLTEGVTQKVDVSPGPESTPVIVDGWVWCVTEHVGTADETYVQGHPIGFTSVIASKRPKGSQDWIDVVHVNGEWVVASCHDGGRLVVESFPDTTPLRTWDEILTPTPPHPPEPPMPTPNHLPTVVTVRSTYPTTVDLGNRRAWEICNKVAWAHRDEGFGLVLKPDGNNYVYDGVGYSIDLVFHLATSTLVDILGSSETLGVPQWSEAGSLPINRWRAAIDPAIVDGTTPPPEPPEPPPVGDLEARVTALEAEVAHIVTTLRSV